MRVVAERLESKVAAEPIAEHFCPGCACTKEGESPRCRFHGYEAVVRRLRAENESLRALLQRLRGWDHMQTAGDGPYWLTEIAKVLDG